jgi:hypothetical protein
VGAGTVEVATDSDAIECIGRGPWQHYVDIDSSELIRNRPERYAAPIEVQLWDYNSQAQQDWRTP